MSDFQIPARETCMEALQEKLSALRQEGTFDSFMNPQLEQFDYDNKELTLRFEVKPWMLNVLGIVHGGLYASMADCVMGSISCFWTSSPITPSVSLQINFLRPAKDGDTLLFRGKIISAGRTMIHASMTAWKAGAPDKPLLTGSGIFFNPHSKD
ncbi:MAG: PaaI family thioesterase [Clostridiales bacterium]|nr:PaaI family thioesterase [Clostridiales bacterium]